MRLATKLFLSTAVLIVLAIGVVGFAMWPLENMQARRDAVLDALSAKVTAAYKWSKLADISGTRTHAMILSSDPELVDVFKKANAIMSAGITELQKQLSAMALTPADRKQMEAIDNQRNMILASRNKIQALHAGNDKNAAMLTALHDEYLPLQQSYSDSLAAFQDLQEQELATAKATFARERNMIATTTAATLVVLALFVVIGAAALFRSIRQPLRETNRLAARIAQGDLSAELHVTRVDEFGELMRSILAMNWALVTIVRRIRAGADNVSTASNQIAAGNLDLSSRTEEQAASLQEAAASMNRLAGTVKLNLENARQANQLAVSAAEAAVPGGSTTNEVIATMKSINEASFRIVDIIGVIDGIAFQTNILALNAAVEAARAGEQGRGFAVVASEMRTLAQRSAAAAKGIKTLIGASVKKVELGAMLVNQAGTKVDEIVHSFKRVTDIIGEITAAGEAQATEIHQINEASAGIDNHVAGLDIDCLLGQPHSIGQGYHSFLVPNT
jgi:methyl-accepting chemotaxis protein